MDERREQLLAKVHSLYNKAAERGAEEDARNILSRYGLEPSVEEAPHVPAMSVEEARKPEVAGNPLSAPMYQDGGYASKLKAQTLQAQGFAELRDKYGDADGDLQILKMAPKLVPYRIVDTDNLFADEEEDPNFDLKSDEVKALISDLPRDYQEKFFREDPKNLGHAQRIAGNLKQEHEIMAEFAPAGFGAMFQVEMASMLGDTSFWATTGATAGVASGLNAAVKTLQLSRTAMKAAKAAEYLGLPLAEAAGYNALVAKTQDTYNGHDAAFDTMIAAGLIGPLGGLGLRSASRSIDLVTMAKTDIADALLEDVAVASQKAADVEAEAAVKPVIRQMSYTELVDDVKAGLIARAGNKNDRLTNKTLVREERMLLDQIEGLKAEKEAFMSNKKGKTVGKTEEIASLNARIETLTDSLNTVKRKLGKDVEARQAEAELTRVEEWLRRDARIAEAQDGKVELELRLQKVTDEAKRSKGKNKKNAKQIKELQAEIAKIDAKVAELMNMEMPSSLKGVEAEMQKRLAEQAAPKAEVKTNSPDLGPEPVEEMTPVQASAARVMDDTEPDRARIKGHHRYDYWGKTQKSYSQTFRNWGHKLMSNGIRRQDDVQLNAADLNAQRRVENLLAPKNKELAQAFRAYLKDLGINRWNIATRHKVHKALSEVSNELSHLRITGQRPDNPHLQKMLDILDDRMAQAFGDAQRFGVNGAVNLTYKRDYMPRIWDKTKMFAIKSKYADKKEGNAQVISAIRNGLINKDPEMPKGAAELIARGVSDAASDGRVVMDDIFEDVAKFKEFMTEVLEAEAAKTGKTFDEVAEETFAYLNKNKKETKGKNKTDVIDRLKPRLDLDIYARSDDDTFSINDMLNMNAFQLSEMYVRKMEGAAALAEKGLNSPKKIAELRGQIERELKAQNLDDVKIRKELEVFDDVITMVNGHPIHFKGLTDKQKEWAGNLLQVSSLQMLGMAGLAGMAELVGAIARGGVITALKSLPAIRGEGSVKLAKEFEKFGFNVDNLFYNHYFNLYEETGMYGQASWFSRHMHDASKGFAVASLMAPFDRWSRQTTFYMSIDKSVELAKKKGRMLFSRAEMGMSEDQYAKAVKYLADNSESTKGTFGDTVHTVNFDKWDADTREAFLSGLYRMNANQVLKILSGERVVFFNATVEQFLFQFQQLLLSGLYKSLGNKVVNWNRAETYLTLMGEIVGGTMWYTARNEIKALGMSDREKDEWREKQFGGHAYWQGALGYTTTLGGAFSIWNKAAAPFGFPTFGQRYQSIEGALFAAPWLNTLENLTRASGNAVMGEFGEQDIQRLWRSIPTNSWYGFHYINNSLLRD